MLSMKEVLALQRFLKVCSDVTFPNKWHAISQSSLYTGWIIIVSGMDKNLWLLQKCCSKEFQKLRVTWLDLSKGSC